jgi:HK97 family phage major capsid protein
MNATQTKLVEDLDAKIVELDAITAMEPADASDESVRGVTVDKLTAEIDSLRSRLSVENKAADARSKAAAVRSAVTTAGVVVPAPAPVAVRRAMPTLGRIQGFDNAEEAAAAGRFLRALARGELRGDFTTPTEEPNAMGEFSPTYDGRGSELVTYDIYRGILNLLSYSSVATQVCATYAVNGPGMYLPVAEMMQEAEFYLENCEIKPVTFGGGTRAALDLKKIGARAQVSNELMEDAFVSVAQLVASQFAYAFARKIDKTWLQGDTVAGIPGGGLCGMIPASNIVASTGALSPEILAQVVSCVNPNARNRAWVVSPAGWGQIMAVAAGAIGASIGDAVRPVVYGAPVYQSQDLPADTLAVYGDFGSSCAIGYKPAGLQIRASTERAIEYDETVFVGTARYAWSVHSPSYCAKLTGVATPSAPSTVSSDVPSSKSAPTTSTTSTKSTK